jgi:PHD/YefM family antitoxin component YafN of YafNO toxin-antitoxin module
MKGINYITDERGKKTAVVISLKNYEEEIEDFLDGLEAQSRLKESSSNFEKSLSRIIKSKSNNGKISAKNKKIS